MKKLKILIYAINIKLILLDICLIIFIILILYFSYLHKSNIIIQSPATKQVKQNKISLNLMKELSDRKVHGVPYLNFKLPNNLYNDLENDNLSKKTPEEKTLIFNQVESFIKNVVKEKIKEKIKIIDNSLTENDYDITFIQPNSMRVYNSRYKSIAMDFIIEGKNKATGKVEKKLTVDVSIY
ncbi:hypothetical protein D6D54_07500 [Spiroplasma poulsonii]|uniref:Uncharacterized protein n=2 Tax=Spiroplasma poulsonii TaxID=2138 RepID=A0A433ENH6_9MOLU|nr:hypothetical protein [Spiroplasma poulsonii]RUP75876.1 hypothetical protein D6D54_07500 [Spiroplasma poulsonii]